MSQFSVYKNKNPRTKKIYPFLIDIQSDLLDELRTTVVVPVTECSAVNNQVLTKLCPIVEINGESYVAMTQQLAGIEKNLLGKEVDQLLDYRFAFVNAIDLLVTGI